MNILLIDDTNKEVPAIKLKLQRRYATTCILSRESFSYVPILYKFDMVIINYVFFKSDKLNLCKTIKKHDSSIPILVLGTLGVTSYKVAMLDSGADDFLLKPFASAELHARIRVLMRRYKRSKDRSILRVQNLVFDTTTKRAYRENTYIDLRPKEALILEYLLQNAGRIISRGMILDHVWNTNYELYDTVVLVHMKHLRDKVDGAFPNKLIKTVYGFGYTIE